VEKFVEDGGWLLALQGGHIADVVLDIFSEEDLCWWRGTSKSILAQTMQWMGFSGRMRMVHTGNTFCGAFLGSQE
jgi:hypothetical protein